MAREADEPMTARGAVETIRRIEDRAEALRRRTSGVTWMIWGVAIAGMFVAYSFIGVIVDAYAPEAANVFPWLWLPWVAMGLVATIALWRSVGLVAPGIANRRQGWITFAVFFVLMGLGMMAAALIDPPIVEPLVSLALLGVATAAIGVSGLNCYDRIDRILWVGGGLLVLAVVAVTGALLPGVTDTAYAVSSLVGPLVVILVYFGNGVVLTFRG